MAPSSHAHASIGRLGGAIASDHLGSKVATALDVSSLETHGKWMAENTERLAVLVRVADSLLRGTRNAFGECEPPTPANATQDATQTRGHSLTDTARDMSTRIDQLEGLLQSLGRFLPSA